MTDTIELIESSSWRVGRWTCRLQVREQGPGAVAITDWRPDRPDRLDSAECDQLRAGRAAAKAEIEAALGRGIRLA